MNIRNNGQMVDLAVIACRSFYISADVADVRFDNVALTCSA
jgi:hypothetical protein